MFNREVSISVFQPPLDFFESLEFLDLKSRHLAEPNAVWKSFFDSDVWVFFILNADELSQLPRAVGQVIEQGGLSQLTAVNRMDVTLADQRKVIIFILDVSQYRNINVVGCKSAVAVYSHLLGFEKQHSAPLYGNCDAKDGK